MKTYSLRFEVQDVSDVARVEELFYNHFDGLVAESFGRLLLTVYMDGHENGPMAAKCAATELEKLLGVTVARLDRDLVDAAEIARRCDRSRESVRQLIEGTRRKGTPFPTPAGAPNGKRIWEWSVVNEWLRENVPESAEPEFGLSRDEMTLVDGWLLRWRSLPWEQHVGMEFREITATLRNESVQTRSPRINQAWVKSWNVTSRVIREPAAAAAPECGE
ncbi:hypothetical protein [Streptomyces nymphaeiformis]|uniref:DNA-binding protein n=1 Tax=Streptomyces nymphaeiformis TaxID=2663842 RepID=A0A7W7X9T3_9ACTN|nr:hypothetical protein [Streptomyces nymphaeiformis]MBB4979726.1 hypothetical protein [Streptomyces nymphaeiformis]